MTDNDLLVLRHRHPVRRLTGPIQTRRRHRPARHQAAVFPVPVLRVRVGDSVEEDAELVGTGVGVELCAADGAGLAGEALALALVVGDDGGLVLARHDLLDGGGIGAGRDDRGGGQVGAVGDCVCDFCLAHCGELVDELIVAVAGGVVFAEVGSEDASVGVDRVVADRVAEELEVDADLVRAACEREAVDDAVAFFFVGVGGRGRGGARGVVLVLVLVLVLRRIGRSGVVGDAAELGGGFFAGGAHAVQAQLGADGHDGLVADDDAVGELALDAGDVLLLDGALAQAAGDHLGTLLMFRDEHDARGEAVEAVAGPRGPLVGALGAQDLDDGVVVVAAGGVDGHAGGLINDEDVVVLVDDADGLAGDGGFMAVEGVGDDLAVLDDGVRTGRLPADGHLAVFEGLSVIVLGAIAKLGGEDVDQLPAAPSFLAEGIVGVVVGSDATEASFEVVWSGPRVAGEDGGGLRFGRHGVGGGLRTRRYRKRIREIGGGGSSWFLVGGKRKKRKKRKLIAGKIRKIKKWKKKKKKKKKLKPVESGPEATISSTLFDHSTLVIIIILES